MGNFCVLLLCSFLHSTYTSASSNSPLLSPSLHFPSQSAKHKVKETYDTVTEKLGATPQSAREYKKGMEETASETMGGKKRRSSG